MDNLENNFSNILILFFAILAIIFVLLFLYIYFKGKAIKKNNPKRRFKYLDTFYYHFFDNEDFVIKAYIIVSDVDSSIIYAIPRTSFTNVGYDWGTNSVLKGKGLNLKKVKYGDQGSLWIDKEEKKFYKRTENVVKFGRHMVLYTKEKDKGFLYLTNMPRLYNIDNSNDVSLLDKAVFVAVGIAEFDIEE